MDLLDRTRVRIVSILSLGPDFIKVVRKRNLGPDFRIFKSGSGPNFWLAQAIHIGILIPFCDCILSCFLFAVLTFDRNTQRTRLLVYFNPFPAGVIF